MTRWSIVLLCFGFDILVADKRELPDPLSDPEKLLNMGDLMNFDYLKDMEDIIKSKISLQPMLPNFQKEKETDTKELSFADLLKVPADVDFQINPDILSDIGKIQTQTNSSPKTKKKYLKKPKKNSMINFKQLMELDRFLHSKTKLRLEDNNEKVNFKDILSMGYRKNNRGKAKRKKQNKENVLSESENQNNSPPELSSDLKLSLKSLVNQLESRNQDMTIKDLVKILKSKKYASDTESESDRETVDPGPLMKLKPLQHKSKQNQTRTMKKKKKNTRLRLSENEMKNMAKIISLERIIRPKKLKKQRKPYDKIKKQRTPLDKLVKINVATPTPVISSGRNPGMEALLHAGKHNSKNNVEEENVEEVQNLEATQTTEETATEEYGEEETETTLTTDTTTTTDATDTTESDATEADEDETTETDVTEETTTEEVDTEEAENATLGEVVDAPLDR